MPFGVGFNDHEAEIVSIGDYLVLLLEPGRGFYDKGQAKESRIYMIKPATGEVFGLYVFPEARGTGVSWRLVEAAAALAAEDGYSQLFYWAGVDNPRAIGFANNFGFRVTGYRRQARNNDLDLGEDEVALVLSLMNDDSAVPPNPTSRKPAPREGPLR